MEPINTYKTTNFTGRCVQVRDAQWVCHTINSNFPHLSSTRYHHASANLIRATFKIPPDIDLNKILDLRAFLYEKIPTKNELSDFDFKAKLTYKISNLFRTKKQKDNIKILKKYRDLIDEIVKIRNYYGIVNLPEVLQSFIMLQNAKRANCSETAVLAELTMKLNGIHNARFAALHDEKNNLPIDHAVCIFNKDGSTFDGIISNKTIVIDPWAQKADFASNMAVFYKNQLAATLNLKKDATINYKIRETINSSNKILTKFKEKYPILVFPNKTHKFMQNKKP